MARKINTQLLERLTSGDLLSLLNYIKSDNDLRIEVREGGRAFVYYRKGKALEISLSGFSVDERYITNASSTVSDMMSLVKSNPAQYFKCIKEHIDNYVNHIKKRQEFDTQQKIASQNQKKDDKYIIIDMEYTFPQSSLEKSKREKRASFDLLGIERESGKIVFFEVKKGGSSLTGNTGIKSHIEDFEQYFFGENAVFFHKILKKDIENIVLDKRKLGIIDFSLPTNYDIDGNNIDFVFVFEADENTTIQKYCNVFSQEVSKIGSKREYKTLFVSPKNKYKLLYRESERIKMAEWRSLFLDKKSTFVLDDGRDNLYSGI